MLETFASRHWRRGDTQAIYDNMTGFFGQLFLVNFAVGVVTGIVQEFQFGMSWSQYCPRESALGSPSPERA